MWISKGGYGLKRSNLAVVTVPQTVCRHLIYLAMDDLGSYNLFVGIGIAENSIDTEDLTTVCRH